MTAMLVAFVVTLALMLWLKHSIIDDAFIQLTYARNLIESGTWGMFPDRIANTATSPLNVLVTAALSLVLTPFSDWLTVAAWLTAFEFTALLGFLLLLSYRLFRNPYVGLFAFVAFVTNPLLLSTIGMESVLYALFFVAAIYFLVKPGWVGLAISLGLLTLARPEGVLLLIVLLPIAPLPTKQRWKIIVVYMLTILPWLLFSWLVVGSLFPDTMIIKTGQGSWKDGISFHNGIRLYLDAYPLATLVSLIWLPLGLFAFWRTDKSIKLLAIALLAYGTLHYLAYAALRVPPYHWYYTHQIIVVVLVAALGVGSLLQHVAFLQRYSAARTVLALLPALGLVGLWLGDGWHSAEAPIHTNWATHDQFYEVGRWLNDNLDSGTVIQTPMELGTIAFYSEQRLLNEFSDLNWITRTIDDSRYMQLPGVSDILRWNYIWRRAETADTPTYILKRQPVTKIDLTDESIIKTWSSTSAWAEFNHLGGDQLLIYLEKAPPGYWQE